MMLEFKSWNSLQKIKHDFQVSAFGGEMNAFSELCGKHYIFLNDFLKGKVTSIWKEM